MMEEIEKAGGAGGNSKSLVCLREGEIGWIKELKGREWGVATWVKEEMRGNGAESSKVVFDKGDWPVVRCRGMWVLALWILSSSAW